MLFRVLTALFLLLACAHAMVVPLPQRMRASDHGVSLAPLTPPPGHILPPLPATDAATSTTKATLIRHTRIQVITLANNAKIVIKSTWFSVLRACGLRPGQDAALERGAHGHGRVSGGLNKADLDWARARHDAIHRGKSHHTFPSLFWAARARHGHGRRMAACKLTMAGLFAFFLTMVSVGGLAVLIRRRREARRLDAASSAASAEVDERQTLVSVAESEKSDNFPDTHDRTSTELLPPYTKADE